MEKLEERELRIGDLVVHFKHELHPNEKITKYIYKIKDIAMHTETRERLVIYENIESGERFARPIEMFLSKVEHDKYPDIKQKYRLEKVTYEVLKNHDLDMYKIYNEVLEYLDKNVKRWNMMRPNFKAEEFNKAFNIVINDKDIIIKCLP